MPIRNPPLPARQAALELIARRLVSEAELRRHLEGKGYAATEIDDAVSLMRSYRYLDDATLVEAVVREAERSIRGPHWVRQTLLRRGLSEDLCAQAEQTLRSHATTLARRLVLNRFGPPESLTDPQRRRAFRLLLGRGFDVEHTSELLGWAE